MKNYKTITGIILVAGNSIRFGKNRNKNFEKINEKEIMLYSVKAFDNNEFIDDIIIVAKESEKSRVEEIFLKEKLTKKIKIVNGGSSRQESVYNAIKECNSDIVIIHDGARPFIKQEFINYCIKEVQEYCGVTVAVKSKDTIKIADENGIVKESTNRENTWIIQTPQCFDRKVLLEAHEKFKNDSNITDDCMLIEKLGKKVKLVEGDYSNIKITTYDDLNYLKNSLK